MSASANIRAGRAYVEVTAETSKLKQNLNAAQSQLRDFGKACQGLGRDMMALGGERGLASETLRGLGELVELVSRGRGDRLHEPHLVVKARKGLLGQNERQRQGSAQRHHVTPQPLTRLSEVTELRLRGVEVGAEL